MIATILKLGGLQAFLLAAFLLRKKANNKANLVLAILVFALGLSSFFYAFNDLDVYLQFPHLIRIDWGIPLLFGPLVYLYTLYLINKEEPWSQRQLLHFLPYFLNLVILAPFFIQTAEEKIQILDYFTASITSGTDHYVMYNGVLRFATSFVSIFYALKSLELLGAYRKKLLNEFSDIQKIKLEWLAVLLYSFLLLSVGSIIVSLIATGERYPDFDYNVYYFVLVFVFIYALTYYTLSQPRILQLPSEDSENISPKSSPPQTSSLSDQAQQLQAYMRTQRPYLDGDLTASSLADQLEMSRHQLSDLLNKELQQNFYDFINAYRVEEFKQRLQSDEHKHLTLLAIALESGFNSKTSFNTIFKKATGLPPSQYKKSLK